MLRHGREWWWKKLFREFFDINKITKGNINLSYGQHEVFIAVPCLEHIEIARIYLSCDGIGDPVCQGDVDCCGHTMVDGGFVIYADIKHNISNIYWIIEYNVIEEEEEEED